MNDLYTEPKFILAHRPNRNHRTSSDGAWPLRRANGMTWAESKKEQANANTSFGVLPR
jgi:hypothetical protein